jgi:hypothetical protein
VSASSESSEQAGAVSARPTLYSVKFEFSFRNVAPQRVCRMTRIANNREWRPVFLVVFLRYVVTVRQSIVEDPERLRLFQRASLQSS